MNIKEFKKGDIIVRVEPAKSQNTNPFLFGEPEEDRTYMGLKMKFVGIANAMIYVEMDESNLFVTLLNLNKFVLSIPYDLFEEGWDYWVDPKTLFEDDLDDVDNKSNDEIEELIKKAIAEENYEKAAKLRDKIKD